MQTASTQISTNPNTDQLIDIREACRFWGGNKPLNPATLYRQISQGKHPKPVKIGGLSRWSLLELCTERQRRMDAR